MSPALLILLSTAGACRAPRGEQHARCKSRPFKVTNARLLLYRTITVIYIHIRNCNHIIVNKSFLRNLCPDRKCMLTGTETNSTQVTEAVKGRPRDTGERRGAGRCCQVRLLPWGQLSGQPGLPDCPFLQEREDRSTYCIIRKSWFWGSAGGDEIKPPVATCHLRGPEQQTRTNLVLGPQARLSPTCVLHQKPAPCELLTSSERPCNSALWQPAPSRF